VEGQAPAGIDVRRIIVVIRRHILLIVVLTLALGGAAYAYSASKTPMYEATAQMLYSPQLNVNDPLNQGYTDPTSQELEMQSAVTIVTGPELSKSVETKLGDPASWPLYDVSAAVTTSDAQATGATDNGVAVTVDSTDPQWAAKLANAYAYAFVQWRIETDQARLAKAEAVISQQLKSYQTAGQKASTDYVLLTQRLQDLQILSSTATGNFSVAVPASPPGAPYAPRPMRSAVLGGAFGFVLAVGLAFLREKLDTKLHDSREVREITQLPVIGRVGRIPDEALAKGPLIVTSEPEGRAAEAIRALRSSLQFAALGEESRVLMVVSAQKGEGKSLLTANLAVSLALAGKRVVLVDADLRRPRLHTLFRIRNSVGASSVIAGITPLADAIQAYEPLATPVVTVRGNGRGDTSPGEARAMNTTMWILTSGPIPPNPGEMVSSSRFAAMIQQLVDQGFDHVLIDSPAFLPVGDTAALAAVADGILYLVNMQVTKKPVLDEARDFLASLPPKTLGIVTVMDSGTGRERYHYYTHGA
jgi:polysaccharide biosynthesis transport protein